MPALKLPRIPRSRKSLNTPPSKHKALLIGINYISPPDQPRRKRLPPQLKGPVRDVKEMKSALMGVYNYPEDGIFVMTDEEQHKGTSHWPSKANILQAIADFVDGASAGDAFIFYYAGHSGQQPAEKDTREIDGLDEYIVTCDGKIILDDTLRERLVDRLPEGTRLTAILDACHSGTLLDLEHYSCHWFIRRRCQSLRAREKPVARFKEVARRHTVDPRHVPHVVPPPRITFSRAATITLAIVRLQFLRAKSKKPRDDPPSPPERPLCRRGGWYCAYTLLKGPLVISVSACSDHESTFEDSQRLGKGMTMKLIKILKKDPSIKVGDLNQKLEKSLFKLAIKRVCKAKKTFELGTKKLSPEQKKKLKDKYTAKGLFEFKPQTAQIGSLHSLSLDEQFILKRRELLG